MKHLVGIQQTKKIPFMGDEIEILKLPVSKILELQKSITAATKSKDELAVLRVVLRAAVIGAEEMTDEDFTTFPASDLNEVAEAILEYCGLSEKKVDEGN